MTNSRDAFTATDVHASNAAPLVGGVRQPPWLPVDFVDRCGCGRRRPDRPGRCPGKSGSGRGLLDTMGGDHRRSCLQMIVVGGFAPRQHRRNTCVSAGENPRPLVAGSAGKSLGEDVIHLRVAGHIELSRHVSGRQAEPAQQRREELRLDCPNGHVLAVGRFVAAVERGAAVEQERFALVAQAANPLHGPSAPTR